MSTAVLLLLASVGSETKAANLPEGFVLERASSREGSFLTLAFDDVGRAIVGVEDGPILRLADTDHDGIFDADEVFGADLFACQGLAIRGDETFAVAHRDGRAGLWRIAADGTVLLLLGIESPSEHGAHGIAFGPDGALFLACGNESSISTPPTWGLSLDQVLDGSLLPTFEDPLGIGAATKVPYGFVARVDPASGAWGYHSIGYRNHYDLAFDDEGELFTWDSDMEYDEGLPWYRPTRALHTRYGIDYGFRRGSSPWREHRPECGASMADTGRGSPSGITFASRTNFPTPWRERLFACDWSRGRIVAFDLEPRGSTFVAQVHTFAEGDALASVTDAAVGPDGALYVLRGGRGLVGPMQRIAWRGAIAKPVATERASTDRANAGSHGAPPRDWNDLGDGSPARMRRVRRIAEDLARTPELVVHEARALTALLDSNDRALRQSARGALSTLEPTVRLAIARDAAASEKPRIAVEGFLLLASACDGVPRPEEVERAARLATEHADARVTVLCALSDALRRGSIAQVDFDAALTAISREHEPDDSASLWELDDLRSCVGGPTEIEGFVTRAERSTDRADALRAAWLAASTTGFTPALLARYLAWHETTRVWSGGASFHGYLNALRDRAATDDAVICALLCDDATAGTLPPPALAFALRRASGLAAEKRVEWGVSPSDLARRYAELEARHGATLSSDARRAAIVEITTSSDPAILEWLRARARVSEEERGLALTALARIGQPEDTERFVAGLLSSEFGTPRACADALRSLPEPPSDGAIWSRVLEHARSLGHPRGWIALGVIQRWLGQPSAHVEEPGFDGAWRAAHDAVRRRFRELPPSTVAAPRPTFEAERVRRFLRSTRDRPASAAAGALAFSKATCASCHTINGRALAADLSRGGSGPDLGGVSRRLRVDELFDAIARPSLAISDQFRAFVVETKDETRLEGRIHREDETGIELIAADGRAQHIARADIAALRPSMVSAMPEGLLALLTLEETRDLFEFLRVETPSSELEAPWKPMFSSDPASGWTGGAGVFAQEDGVLVGRASDLPTNVYCLSLETVADFEAEFDVRITRGGNSGFAYRARREDDTGEPSGYQADIGQVYWGSLYAADGRRLIHETEPNAWRAAVDVTGWNHYFVRVVGDHHVIEVNGAVLTDMHDAAAEAGRFGFQAHAGSEMDVRVANARIRFLR